VSWARRAWSLQSSSCCWRLCEAIWSGVPENCAVGWKSRNRVCGEAERRSVASATPMAGPPTCPRQCARSVAWSRSRVSMRTKADSSVPSGLSRWNSMGSSPVASKVMRAAAASAARSASSQLWHRLLRRSASESGRLRHGDGGPEGRDRRRRSFVLPILSSGPATPRIELAASQLHSVAERAQPVRYALSMVALDLHRRP